MKNQVSLILIICAIVYSTRGQCNYSSPDGLYKVSWFLDKDSPSMVHFKLTAKQKATDGYWTGVGFGPGMSGGDLIIVSTVGDTVAVTDRHGVGFAEPAIDSQQNIQILKAGIQDGTINVEFTRAINTGDLEDMPLKDEKNCQQFIFPQSGGKAASLQSIQKHDSTPVKRPICEIDKCTAGGEEKPGHRFGLPQRTDDKKPAQEATTVKRPTKTEIVTDAPNTDKLKNCPPRKDHAACKKYVDNYLDMVFTTFDRSPANFQKACNLLLVQQEGLVNRECCNYLSEPNVCQQFMKPS